MASAMAESTMVQECAVCVEIYRDPRILECAHHFCKVCLEEIAERHPQGYTTCPICRHVTQTDGVKAVEALPRYRMLNYFIDEVNQFESNTGQKATTKICDMCSEVVATKSCLQCQLNYCDTCVKDHVELETISNHTVYPISKYMFCEQHDAHAVCMCQQCGVVCCVKCTMTSHKGHQKADVQEMTKTVKARLLQYQQHLTEDKQAEDVYKKVQAKLQEAQSVQLETNKEADALIVALKQLIQKVENIKSEVSENLTSTIKTLSLYEAELRDFLDSKRKLIGGIGALSQKTSLFEMIAREGSMPQYGPQTVNELFTIPTVSIPDMSDSFKDIKEQIDKYRKTLTLDVKQHDFTWRSNAPIENLVKLHSWDAENLVWGIVADEKESKVIVRRQNAANPITVYEYNGTKVRTLCANIPGIASFGHQGITIDTKRNLYVIPVNNSGITTIDKEGAIVATFNVQGGVGILRGICYSNKDLYIVSRNESQSVYIVNPDSKSVIQTIVGVQTTYSVGTGIIKLCNTLIDAIMISMHGSNCVRVVDFDGRLLHTYGNLCRPWGLVADPSGRILVCGDGQPNVKAMQGNTCEILLNKSQIGFFPLHITLDLKSKIMLVAHCDGNVASFKY